MPQPKRHRNAAAKQRSYRQRLEAKFGASVCPAQTPKASPVSVIPSTARWRAMREHAVGLLGNLKTEMENYRADRTGNWQESEKGEAFQEKLDLLQEAVAILDAID
jgi:hypothetical protein